MKTENTFSKSEHLCGDKRIERLYAEGEAFIVYPLRVVFLMEEKTDDEVAKVLVGVPKKRFKRAVKRNRLKRLMRESYRLNKSILIEQLIQKEKQIQVAFNYVADQELDFEQIEKKMKLALDRLIKKMDEFESKSFTAE